MPLLRRSDANSRSNVRPATGVPDHRAANSEKEATLTKQAKYSRGRIFSREDIFARGYFREKIFSREDIFAGRYFRVNSIFAKISSRKNISNSLFAKFSSREKKCYTVCDMIPRQAVWTCMQEQIVPETYVSIVKDQHVERQMTQVKSSLEFQVRSQLEWGCTGGDCNWDVFLLVR